MKINGFSIKIGSERIYSSNESFTEKRETSVNPLKSFFSGNSGDKVSISTEKSLNVTSEKNFRTTGLSTVKSVSSNPESPAMLLETITRSLTGTEISVTDIYSKTSRNSVAQNQPSSENSNAQSMQIKISGSYSKVEAESLAVASSGTIQTQDGREISFSLFMEMQSRLEIKGNETTIGDARMLTDPIVINLDGKPPELSDSVFSFDIDSDGTKDEIHSLGKGSGFLALDVNKDGRINNGTELFGPSSGNGFMELSAHDENRDGWIDENDSVYSELVIWTRDENGESRLTNLETAGVGAIFTGSTESQFSLSGSSGSVDGILRRTGLYVMESGEVQNAYQIDLAKKTEAPTETQPQIANAGNPGTVNESRHSMLQRIREQIAKMKENIEKSMNTKNDGKSSTDDFMDKMKNRLDDLMKHFDKKIQEGRKKQNRSITTPARGISRYV